MKKLRKFLTLSVMVMSIAVMSGFASLSPANASAQAGDLIKMDGLSSVYYLGADGKRYVFPSESVYFSWYSDFSGVVTIPAAELQTYPLGANVTMRPGTKLVKITTDPSVYAVSADGTLRKIQSEADAIALYGSSWASMVVDVADSFFTNYTIGTPLPTGSYPAGTLLKNANNASVYYFDGTNYRMVASEAAFMANRFMYGNIVTTTMTLTASGSAINGMEDFSKPSGSTGGTVITGSGLTVALSSATPVATTLINGQSIAPLASFNFTAANDGAIVINTLKLKRTGISSDSSLSNVYLYEGNTKLTDNASLSSGTVTFSSSNGIITVPAGMTKTITVKADVTGSTGNIGMSIEAAASVVTTAGAVSGSFPMAGNLMSMTTATDLAKVDVQTPSFAGANINAGTMNATLWSSQFQVTNKAVDLKYVSFKQVGSIPMDAIENLSLYVNGVQVGSSVAISSDNRVTFDFSNSPVLLATGAATVELRGDIVKGSSRTFSFSLQTASDVVVTDTNYNVNVAITGAGLNASSSSTVSPGSMSISSDSTFVSTEVLKNASNVTFAKYTMKAFGENVKVNSLRVTPTFTNASSTEGINDLALYVNGAQVGSSQAWNVGEGAKDFGTSNLFTVEAGKTVTVEIRGTLDLVSTGSVSADDVQTDLWVMANKLEGASSYTTSPGSSTQYVGKKLAIVVGNLTVSPDTGLQNQYVAKNTNNVKVGSYILKAGSSEGVRVTNLRVDVSGTATTTELNKLANLYVSGNTTPVLPQLQNNFPVNFTLAANETKTIDVYMDLGDLTANATIATGLVVTGVSTPSNTSVSETAAGQTMTVKTGTLAVPTLVNNAPVASLVTGGSSNQLFATYKFVATNSNVKLDQLKFEVTKTATTSPNATAIQTLSVNGMSAPVVKVGSDYVVDLNGLNITVPAGTQGLNVEVKATFNNVTSANQGGALTHNDVRIVLTDYKYIVGNTTTTDSGSIASNTMVLVAGAPVVTDATPTNLSKTLVAGGNNEVMRFSVTAQNSNINLSNVAVNAFASYGLTNPDVYIYDVDNMTTALNATGTTYATSTVTSIPFDYEYTINAGTTKTFVVKVDNTGTTVVGDYFRMDLTNGTDALATGTAWQWNDGTDTAYMNAYLVKTLPITGVTFTK
ncbi:MAG: hypothetical protein PHE20_01700 [Patescibacteria group bacterium]|nr:hypothetical protein [Patescibacteria group bacterium]